jgi:chromosome segregation ATPase
MHDSEKIDELKQNLAEREKELEELRKFFDEIKTSNASLLEQKNLKENQINTLISTIKTKDDMMKTIQDSIQLKDSQIEAMKSSIKTKDKTIEELSGQLKNFSHSTVDENVLKEKNDRIKELEDEITKLNEELAITDKEIENLTIELEKLQSSSSAKNGPFIDFTDNEISREEIIQKMKDILSNALHSVTISSPLITDLQDLDLYEVKTSVNMKISCLIDPTIEEHIDLLEEFESLDNINIRTYDSEDRWLIFRDGEELFFCGVGTKPNNFLTFYTKDQEHIKLFSSLINETWLRSRKI